MRQLVRQCLFKAQGADQRRVHSSQAVQIKLAADGFPRPGTEGLLEKLERVGWAGLSTAESGRIGGKVGAKKREKRKE